MMSEFDVDTNSAPSAELSSLGVYLRNARQAAGYSLEDISQSLRFSISQLEALENEQFEIFSSRVYLQGIARNYGKFLSLAPDEVALRLEKVLPADVAPAIALPYTQEKFEQSTASGAAKGVLVIAVVMVLGGAGFFAFQHWLAGKPSVKLAMNLPASQPVIETAASIPPSVAPISGTVASQPLQSDVAAQQPAKAPQEAAASHSLVSRLNLSSDQPAWVEVRDGTGQKLVSQMLMPGQPIELSASKPLQFKLGKASHVVLKFNDQAIDLSSYIKGEVAKFKLD